ncbi:MAG: hypothetical protein RLZZ453_1289 [Chlamydiota bacterium]|jgi:hypothetical protein
MSVNTTTRQPIARSQQPVAASPAAPQPRPLHSPFAHVEVLSTSSRCYNAASQEVSLTGHPNAEAIQRFVAEKIQELVRHEIFTEMLASTTGVPSLAGKSLEVFLQSDKIFVKDLSSATHPYELNTQILEGKAPGHLAGIIRRVNELYCIAGSQMPSVTAPRRADRQAAPAPSPHQEPQAVPPRPASAPPSSPYQEPSVLRETPIGSPIPQATWNPILAVSARVEVRPQVATPRGPGVHAVVDLDSDESEFFDCNPRDSE